MLWSSIADDNFPKHTDEEVRVKEAAVGDNVKRKFFCKECHFCDLSSICEQPADKACLRMELSGRLVPSLICNNMGRHEVGAENFLHEAARYQ